MKRHILCLDKVDAEIGKIQKEMSLSWDWTNAHTIVEAKRKLANEKFDLILMEADLDDGDGFHFCSWLTSHPIYRSIAVVFLTERDGEIEKKHALKLGARGYLTKPSSATAIKEAITKALLAPKMPEGFIEGNLNNQLVDLDESSQDQFAEKLSN